MEDETDAGWRKNERGSIRHALPSIVRQLFFSALKDHIETTVTDAVIALLKTASLAVLFTSTVHDTHILPLD